MARRSATINASSFSQVDDLVKEITELARLVNARLVVDDDKVQELKSSKGPPPRDH
jgi:hypothetical protein